MKDELDNLFKELMENRIESIQLIDQFINKWHSDIDPNLLGTLNYNKAFLLEKNSLIEESLIEYKKLQNSQLPISTRINVLLGQIRCLEKLNREEEIALLKVELKELKH